MIIRNETPGDNHAIRQVVADAFGGGEEADLVDRLRENGDLAISMVAIRNDVLGHVALSRLKSPGNALALTPVSVISSRQGEGIGTILVQSALDEARAQGFDIVFVLGAPDYYRRFGFSLELAKEFDCIYAGRHFMGLWLGEVRSVDSMKLVYPDAFLGLD